MSFTAKSLFLTITNITNPNFLNPDFEELSIEKIKDTFKSKKVIDIYLIFEMSTEQNKHVHLLISFNESYSFRRSYMNPLLEFFGTTALNIKSFKPSDTYLDFPTKKRFFGNAKKRQRLWKFQQICYCWIDKPEHKIYFSPDKYKEKIQTFILSRQEHDVVEYEMLKTEYDEFLNTKGNINISPAKKIDQAIIKGEITEEILERIIIQDDKNYNMSDSIHCLKHYDKLLKMIQVRESILDKIEKRKNYTLQVTKYKPFQKECLDILENQNSRQISFIIQPAVPIEGSGKTHFCKNENNREDTCFMTNAKTSSLAFFWNPKKHKRIVFNIEKNGMRNLNYRAIENLKDGAIFSQKYESYSKVSKFRPKIIIFGNEYPENNWTQARLNLFTLTENEKIIKEEDDRYCQEGLS